MQPNPVLLNVKTSKSEFFVEVAPFVFLVRFLWKYKCYIWDENASQHVDWDTVIWFGELHIRLDERQKIVADLLSRL